MRTKPRIITSDYIATTKAGVGDPAAASSTIMDGVSNANHDDDDTSPNDAMMKDLPEKVASISIHDTKDDPPLVVTPLLEKLPQMVAGVMGNNSDVQVECTTQIKKLISVGENSSPAFQEVIDANVVPRFIQFLSRDDRPDLQFEAAWALTNITYSATSEHVRVVIDNGAVPILIELLSNNNDQLREQAIWTLGNIAGDAPEYRDCVLNAGAMGLLLQQLQTNCKLSMMRIAIWAVSNLCSKKPEPSYDLVRPTLPILAELICHDDEEVLIHTCWALSHLSHGPNDKVQAVIDTGVCQKVVELLGHSSQALQLPALRTVGNIITGNEEQTQFMIDNNVLPHLLKLLQSPNKIDIRKKACWTTSNITAGTHKQIQAVIDANIIPSLVELLQDSEFSVREEAAWAICNAATGGTRHQNKFLVSQNCIPPLCEIILKETDVSIVKLALEALENMLKVGETEKELTGDINGMAKYITESSEGIIDKLKDLQHHSNYEIYEKASKIIDYCFDDDEEVED